MNIDIENMIKRVSSYAEKLKMKLQESPEKLTTIELRFLCEGGGIGSSDNLTKNEMFSLLGISVVLQNEKQGNKNLSSVPVLFTNIKDKEDKEEFESLTQASLCLGVVRSTNKMRNIIKFGTVFWYNGKQWIATRMKNLK